MKSMLVGFVAIAVIAVGADIVLESMGYSVEEANTGNAVRLDKQGE